MLSSKYKSNSKKQGTNKNAFLTVMTWSALIVLFSGSPVFAQQASASQKAMKIAEQQTQGKAVKTKYFESGNKKGYKVRILKNGNVSHVFISLAQLK